MADYAALKTEMAKPEYVGLSNADAASRYNAKTATVRSSTISVAKLLAWAGTGPIDSIDAAQTFVHPSPSIQRAIRSAAKAGMRVFSSVDSFDLDLESNRASLAAFVAVGVITQEELDALLAMGDVAEPLYSRPGQFGCAVGPNDVAHARAI